MQSCLYWVSPTIGIHFGAQFITEMHHTQNSYLNASKLTPHLHSPHVQWGSDLQSEHERYLVSHCGQLPVFVTHFPAAIKPFYAKTTNDGSDTVSVYDMSFMEVEPGGQGAMCIEHVYVCMHECKCVSNCECECVKV